MKRLRNLLTLLLFTVLLSTAALAADTTTVALYSVGTGRYETTTVGTASLELDGEAVENDLDPFILDGRTLVPVRVISENLGADVSWDADTQQVTITTDEKTIVLTIGSATALVNGEETELPDGVAAGLVQVDGGSRTVVPVRFISEQLGAEVEWDDDSRTVIITSAKPAAGTVLSITAQDNQVLVETDGALEESLLTLEGRLVIDLPGMLLDGDSTGWTGQLDLEDLAASDLRFSQYDTGYSGYDRVVRLVFDLKDGAEAADITVSWEEDTLVCTLAAMEDSTPVSSTLSEESATVLPEDSLPSEDTAESEDPDEDEDADEDEEDEDESTVQDADLPPAVCVSGSSAVSIMLDAGHGGSDTGCQFSGTDEKDVNLEITLRLGSILEDLGYTVYYTRTDDTYVSLTDRTDLANRLGVDVFISIHANSYEDSDINGTETYYWTLGTETEAQLAACVQEAIVDAVGSNDRGVKTANYWVTRATDMPAILIETGYMSNAAECAALTDSTYQQKLAEAIADGIVQWLALQ